MFDPPAEMHVPLRGGIGRSSGRTRSASLVAYQRPGLPGQRQSSATIVRSISVCCLVIFRAPARPRLTQAMVAAHAAFPVMARHAFGGTLEQSAPGRRPDEERVFTTSPPRSRSRSARTAWSRSARRRKQSDFFQIYADDFERNDGFEHQLPDDPLPDFRSHNRSVMRPYGAWVVIAPVQLPIGAGGRPGRCGIGHRQHGGVQIRDRYTVVGPAAGRLPARCRLPAGHVQLSVRRGADVGDALVAHPRTAGHHVYRIGPRSAWRSIAAMASRTASTPLHRRDGRQECLHRYRSR